MIKKAALLSEKRPPDKIARKNFLETLLTQCEKSYHSTFATISEGIDDDPLIHTKYLNKLVLFIVKNTTPLEKSCISAWLNILLALITFIPPNAWSSILNNLTHRELKAQSAQEKMILSITSFAIIRMRDSGNYQHLLRVLRKISRHALRPIARKEETSYNPQELIEPLYPVIKSMQDELLQLENYKGVYGARACLNALFPDNQLEFTDVDFQHKSFLLNAELEFARYHDDLESFFTSIVDYRNKRKFPLPELEKSLLALESDVHSFSPSNRRQFSRFLFDLLLRDFDLCQLGAAQQKIRILDALKSSGHPSEATLKECKTTFCELSKAKREPLEAEEDLQPTKVSAHVGQTKEKKQRKKISNATIIGMMWKFFTFYKKSSTPINWRKLAHYTSLICSGICLFLFIIIPLFMSFSYPPLGDRAEQLPRSTQVQNYLFSLQDQDGGFLEDAIYQSQPSLRGTYYALKAYRAMGFLTDSDDLPPGFDKEKCLTFVKSLQDKVSGFRNTPTSESNVVFIGMATYILSILDPEYLGNISVRIGIWLNNRDTLTWSELLSDSLMEYNYWTLVTARLTNNFDKIGLHPINLSHLITPIAAYWSPKVIHHLRLVDGDVYYPSTIFSERLIDTYYQVLILCELIQDPVEQEYLLRHLIDINLLKEVILEGAGYNPQTHESGEPMA